MLLNLEDPTVVLLVILGTATYARYVLGWKTMDSIKWLFVELKDLPTLNINPGALNAAGFIVGSIVICAVVFIPKIDKLLTLQVGHASSIGTYVVAALGALAIWLFTLLCVNMIRPR